MFAVIKTGGKQYLIQKGDILKIEKIEGDPKKMIIFKEVLLTFDLTAKKVEVGQPYLKINVTAEIISQERGKKITIIKSKPKTRYHKKRGHRQFYTEVKIIKIGEEEKVKLRVVKVTTASNPVKKVVKKSKIIKKKEK